MPGADGKLQAFNPIQDIAFHALSHAYAIGYLVCGIAALLAALIAAVLLGGRAHTHTFVEPVEPH